MKMLIDSQWVEASDGAQIRRVQPGQSRCVPHTEDDARRIVGPPSRQSGDAG
jgi:hypothetical protein